MSDFKIRYRPAEPWRGHRWIVAVEGVSVAKGWVGPKGKIRVTHGECPPGATAEIAARFAPDASPASAEEE